MFFFCPPDKCAPNIVILLTFCFPEVLPESVRMDRCPADLHLSHAEKGKNGGWKRMKHGFLTYDTKRTSANSMFGIHLHADLQLFTWPNIAESHTDASICNRGCKRLQPRLQTFASGNSYTHLPGEMPSADHHFRWRWAHGRALWSGI